MRLLWLSIRWSWFHIIHQRKSNAVQKRLFKVSDSFILGRLLCVVCKACGNWWRERLVASKDCGVFESSQHFSHKLCINKLVSRLNSTPEIREKRRIVLLFCGEDLWLLENHSQQDAYSKHFISTANGQFACWFMYIHTLVHLFRTTNTGTLPHAASMWFRSDKRNQFALAMYHKQNTNVKCLPTTVFSFISLRNCALRSSLSWLA